MAKQKPKKPRKVSPVIIVGAGIILLSMILSMIPSDGGGRGQEIVPPTTDDDAMRGNPYAPVTIIAFSDYECDYCMDADLTISQILSEYSDKVNFVFRDFPLNEMYPRSQKAAEASECAGEQGKFWEMHDKLFENQAALTVDDLKKYSVDLSLNTTLFGQCIDSGAMTAEVVADRSDGEKAGVDAVPTFFINDRKLKGAQPIESFKAMIDEELAKVK